jgi:hypothetical protein
MSKSKSGSTIFIAAAFCLALPLAGCASRGTVRDLEKRVGDLETRFEATERRAATAEESAEQAQQVAREAQRRAEAAEEQARLSASRSEAIFRKTVSK